MGKKQENDSDYETDNGSEFEEESEYETDDEVAAPPKSAPTPAKAPAKASANKAEEPCKQYRVDTTASAFGTCKCGWPKVDHEGPRANKAAEALNKLKAGRKSLGRGTSGDGPCLNFRVDVNAEKFGMCKCGHHQSEHVAKKANPAREALMSLKAGSKVRVGSVEKSDAPCDNYHVDPTASEFGTCYCGFKKGDHVKKEEDPAAVMLRKLKEKNVKANEKADMIAAGVDVEEVPVPGKAAIAANPAQTAPAKAGGCCVVM